MNLQPNLFARTVAGCALAFSLVSLAHAGPKGPVAGDTGAGLGTANGSVLRGPAPTPFGNGNPRAVRINGTAVTGFNRVRDDVVAELPFVADLSFSIAGVLDDANPDGPALPITADTADDAIMATYADPEFYEVFYGITNAAEIPGQNVPYADIPQIINELGDTEPVLQQLDADASWWEVNNGAENTDYTLGQWLEASGNIHFFCNPAKGNHFAVRLRNLIPSGMYTLWGYYYDQQTATLEAPFPFGGTSGNVFIANRDGRIRANHNMAFCPQDVSADNDQQMVAIMLTYHPDGQVHAGAEAVLGDPAEAGPGINAIPQLMFPFPQQPQQP